MNNDIQQHLDNHLNQLRVLFSKASAPVEALKSGEHIPLTKLSEDLAKEQGTTGPKLYPIIRSFFVDYPGVVLKNGAKGGVYKLPLNSTATKETSNDD